MQHLSAILGERRSASPYDIDGLVVFDNHCLYERKSENPKHAFAFKQLVNDDIAEVVVTNVVWNISKDGFLKPKVEIEPIKLCGVVIKCVTGFNADYITSNKIGAGALIQITRSGGVIPDILRVVKPAVAGQLPEDIEYVWSDSHVDIIIANMDNLEVRVKTIARFFEDVNGLSEGNVRKIAESGFDSIHKIVAMSEADFLKVDGFKEKTAKKLHDGIRDKIYGLDAISLAYKSNIFGRGFSKKKIESVLQQYPHVFDEDEEVTKEKLMAIKGMAEKSATAFMEKIPEFKTFMSAFINVTSPP